MVSPADLAALRRLPAVPSDAQPAPAGIRVDDAARRALQTAADVAARGGATHLPAGLLEGPPVRDVCAAQAVTASLVTAYVRDLNGGLGAERPVARPGLRRHLLAVHVRRRGHPLLVAASALMFLTVLALCIVGPIWF